MARYSIGDHVRVRSDLRPIAYRMDSGSCGVRYYAVGEMLQYSGSEARITRIAPDGHYYKLDIDDETWKWNDGMLVDAEEDDWHLASDEEFNNFLGDFLCV